MRRNHQRAMRKRRNRHSYKSAITAIFVTICNIERIAVGSNNYRSSLPILYGRSFGS
jgi:hypothetical protein